MKTTLLPVLALFLFAPALPAIGDSGPINYAEADRDQNFEVTYSPEPADIATKTAPASTVLDHTAPDVPLVKLKVKTNASFLGR